MKLDFMKASEARATAKDCKDTVTDEHYAQMVREINRRIGHAAEVGEFGCKVRVDDLFGMVGLKNLSEYHRKPHTLTIINGLRYAGYTAKLRHNYTDEWYPYITISWKTRDKEKRNENRNYYR